MLKTNSIETLKPQVAEVFQHIGLGLMAVAITAGLGEIPQHGVRAVLQTQPVFAFGGESRDANPLRREREETGPHYVSYNIAQRTPGRSGRQ